MNYQRIYDNLIAKYGFTDKPEGYSERHHILPRCLGGGEENSNLIYLRAEAHYVAHQLLVKMNPGHYGISYAAMLMTCGTNQTVRCNKVYGWLRKRMAETSSVLQTARFADKRNHPCYNKFGEDHPRYGIKHSEESKKAIGRAHLGREVSVGSREKLSEAHKEIWKDEKYKCKMTPHLIEIANLRFKCGECAMESNAGGIANHQRKTKHSGKEKV